MSTEKSYPYTENNGTCKATTGDSALEVTGYRTVTSTEDALKAAVGMFVATEYMRFSSILNLLYCIFSIHRANFRQHIYYPPLYYILVECFRKVIV